MAVRGVLFISQNTEEKFCGSISLRVFFKSLCFCGLKYRNKSKHCPMLLRRTRNKYLADPQRVVRAIQVPGKVKRTARQRHFPLPPALSVSSQLSLPRFSFLYRDFSEGNRGPVPYVGSPLPSAGRRLQVNPKTIVHARKMF